MRKKARHWRQSWQREMLHCERLHDEYMSALDKMADANVRAFHFVPSALHERDLDHTLWRQHVLFTSDSSLSYIFEI